MVVTGSRLEAVKYKLAFDKYVRENGYSGIRALVAFSGTVEDPDLPGESFTEVAMNDGLSERALPEAFDEGDYRVLIVADKYQTGFDQPLLQAMYVVKRLAGVQAVQTLSRLNRRAPGKTRTFVLDFVNTEEEIFAAFKPYYETTPVGDDVDPHRLSELAHSLETFAIYTPDDVTGFADIWYKPKRDHSQRDHQAMNAVLDSVVQRFKNRDDDEAEQFRGQLTAWRNLYAFLSQILPYNDPEHEKLYAFIRALLLKLPPRGADNRFVLDDQVALQFFRLRQVQEGAIDLNYGEADPLDGPNETGMRSLADERAILSSLVDKLNQRFGTDFTEADQLFFDQISASAQSDDDIKAAATANTFPNFAAYFENSLEQLAIARMDGNEDIFRRLMNDAAFRSEARDHLAKEIYERVRRGEPN